MWYTCAYSSFPEFKTNRVILYNHMSAGSEIRARGV